MTPMATEMSGNRKVSTSTFTIKGQEGIAANVTDVKIVGAAYYVFLDQELPLDLVAHIARWNFEQVTGASIEKKQR